MLQITITSDMALNDRKAGLSPFQSIQKHFKEKHGREFTVEEVASDKFSWKFDPSKGGFDGQWIVTYKGD